MGFRISVLACPVAQKDALLAHFGWSETGEPDPEYEAPRSCGVLGGHFLVWENWSQVELTTEEDLAGASRSVDLLALLLSETTMWSAAMRFAGGEVDWQVSHSGEDGGNDIDVRGTPPPQWPGILAGLMSAAAAEEEDVDHIFDAAPALFQSITGFRYDELPDLGFMALANARPKLRKPFWKFWG